MNYSFSAGNTAPAHTGSIVLTINGTTIESEVPFAVGTDGIVNAPTQEQVTAGNFLRADNTWASVQTMIGSSLGITDSTDTWTFTANVATRSLTLDLNGTNAVRFTRQADGTVDMVVTGNITGNGTIT